MSKKRENCAVCGTYGFSRTGANLTERGVLMSDNIICVDFRKNATSKYAELHRAFLQSYHPNFYTKLVALRKLDEWLRTIDEIANRRFEVGAKVGYSRAEIENSLFTEVIYNLR